MASSGIHIDPKNKGKFTARAASKGKSVQQQAKSDATGAAGEKQRKRAQFAINARKWAKKRRGKRSSGRKSR
jgi:hypothetical protein